MSTVVVTNVFGPLNKGDEELFGCLLDILEKHDAQVSALARDPELSSAVFPTVDFFEQPGKATNRPKALAVVLRIVRLVALVLSPKIRVATRLLPKSQAEGVRRLLDADLIIACPGGYLEDSRLSGYSQAAQILAAAGSGQRFIMAPQSIGPFRSRFARSMMRRVLRNADEIFVRDTASADLLSSLQVNYSTSVDLALSGASAAVRSSSPAASHAESGSNVVFTVLRWPFPTASDPAAAQELYHQRCAEIIDLLADRGYSTTLMVQVDGDISAIEDVARRTREPCPIANPVNPEEVRELMGSARGVIASRLHSGILGLQSGVPTVMIGYLPKSVGVLAVADIPVPVWPIEEISPSALVDDLLAQPAIDLRAAVAAAASNGADPFPHSIAEILT